MDANKEMRMSLEGDGGWRLVKVLRVWWAVIRWTFGELCWKRSWRREKRKGRD